MTATSIPRSACICLASLLLMALLSLGWMCEPVPRLSHQALEPRLAPVTVFTEAAMPAVHALAARLHDSTDRCVCDGQFAA